MHVMQQVFVEVFLELFVINDLFVALDLFDKEQHMQKIERTVAFWERTQVNVLFAMQKFFGPFASRHFELFKNLLLAF